MVIFLQDDLRKDARLMEFNSIVNKCLRKDPESRRRDLHIRTYVRCHYLLDLSMVKLGHFYVIFFLCDTF